MSQVNVSNTTNGHTLTSWHCQVHWRISPETHIVVSVCSPSSNEAKPVVSSSITGAEQQLRWGNDQSFNTQMWYGTHSQRWQPMKWTAVLEVFFGYAGVDWLGTSRGTPSEDPSDHSVLDSSQPCWHPSLKPHPEELEASRFIIHTVTRTMEYQHAFFPDSVGMWNNLPSDVVEAARLDLFKDQLAKLHVMKTAPNYYT